MAFILDDLIQPFLSSATSGVVEERHISILEPFSMSIRANEKDLLPYAQELKWLRALEQGKPNVKWAEGEPAEASGAERLGMLQGFEGASATTQLAALITTLRAARLEPGPKGLISLYWPFYVGSDVWCSSALARAGSAAVARELDRRGEEVFVLYRHAHGDPCEMSSRDGYSNLLRLTSMALAAYLSQCEFLSLPDFALEMSAERELIKTQIGRVLAYETRLDEHEHPLKGSYWADLLACKMLKAAEELAANMEPSANALSRLQELSAGENLKRETAISGGEKVMVGENKFENKSLTIAGPHKAVIS